MSNKQYKSSGGGGGGSGGGGGNSGAPATLDTKSRQNEFFVHREGIDRDVITADICTYLGNDALVKPGIYRDDQGQEHHGYFVTAYRNLTTAMIEDLKADSARWEAERRKHQNSAAVRYEGSHLQYHNRSQPGLSGPPRASSSYGYTSSKQPYPPSYGHSGYPSAPSSGSYQPQAYPSAAGGYPSGGYPSSGMDNSYPYTGMGMGMGMGMQPSHVTSGPYQNAATGMQPPRAVEPPGSNLVVHHDTPMPDAGPQSGYPPRTTPYQQTPGYAYPPHLGQPQGYAPGGQTTQPQDLFYGRGPGGANPVGSAAPAGYSQVATAAGSGMPFSPESDQYDPTPVSRASAASPGTQAQVPNSGPTERRERPSEYRGDHRGGEYRDIRDRDRRDRDRDDRPSEKRRHRNN